MSFGLESVVVGATENNVRYKFIKTQHPTITNNNMAKGKGYKLTSSAADGSGPKLCAFYSSDKGCRSGSNCKFSHGDAATAFVGSTPAKSPPRDMSPPSPPSVASSSVVSSESDGGVASDGEIDESRAGAYSSLAGGVVAAAPAIAVPNGARASMARRDATSAGLANPFLAAVAAAPPPPAAVPTAAAVQSSEKKKNKRKKSVDAAAATATAVVLAPGENIFDLGGTAAVAAPKNPPSTSPPAKKPKQQQQQQQQRQTPNAPTAVVSFRDLRLPVAPFAPPAVATTATKTAAVASPPPPARAAATPAPPTPQRPPLPPLPTATPSHLRWRDAVISTRRHATYASLYGNPDRGGGDGGSEPRISTRPYDRARCSSSPAAIAIDCEMCESRDPASGRVDTKALCRLSVVDADTPDGPVLLDTLVRPRWPVTDHRTWINGISASSLGGVEFTLEHAQAFMDALCSDQTVIVGHAVHNDLAALRMDHGCVVDTAMLYAHAVVEEGESGTPSLRNLAHGVLGGREMPEVHDSVNDARVALACAVHYVERGGKVDPVEKVYRRSDSRGGRREVGGAEASSSAQQHTSVLLVHRLPVNTLPDHISEMFLAYTSIRPKNIPDIAFAGQQGKCNVEFASSEHAELAYATLVGDERADKTGKMQKRVGLKGGGYVCVRKMKKGK